MKNLKVAVGLAGLLSMNLAHAHSEGHYNHPRYDHDSRQERVNQMQRNQHLRIEQGVESGQLTPWEAEKLSRQQAGISRLEHQFKRDGWLSRKEKRVLLDRLAQASRKIHQLKNNDHYRQVYYSEDYDR